MKFVRYILAATLFITFPWTGAVAATHDALRADLQRVVNAHLAARAKPEHISAISLSVSLPHDPQNVNVVAGRMSIDPASKPITPQTLFQIGSNTKAFTAAILLQLEAEDKLSISETVGDRLPEYPAWRGVTIRQLLNMTSGIPEYLSVPGLLKVEAQNIHRRWTPPQVIAWVDPVYGHAPPPSMQGWSYTNTGYLLSQLIIERVTGRSFAAELSDRFLGSKYGLTNTYYSANVYPQSVVEQLVSGYFWNADPENAVLKPLLGVDMKTADLSWAQAAGSMLGTPEDLTHWVRALYTGSALAPKQRSELLSIVSDTTGKPIAQTTLKDKLGFGLGVGQETVPTLGTFWYYQGETLGYRMLYFYFPGKDVVVAFGLNSSPSPSPSKIADLLRNVYAALVKAGY